MHRNAPLTPEGRLRLCRLIEDGWTVASAAESFRISRQTAHKWWRRYQEAGEAGLVDRSSRPRRCPTKTPAKVERQVVELRRRHQVSAARLAPRAGIPASTLHRIWARHGVSRLSDLERRTGRRHLSHRDHSTRRTRPPRRKEQAKIPKGRAWAGQRTGEEELQRPERATQPRRDAVDIHSAIHALPRWRIHRSTPTSRRLLVVWIWATGEEWFPRSSLRHHRRAGHDRQRQVLYLECLRCRMLVVSRLPSNTPAPSPITPRLTN